jgi:YbbR domain-containing protein
MTKTLSSLSHNLGSLLLALLLAVTVWVIAVSQSDPDEVREPLFTVPITVVNLADGLVAQGYGQVTVQLTLRAPHSVWQQMQQSDVRILLDLAGRTEGVYDLPLTVAVDRAPIRVDTIFPASLHITIDRVLQRTADIHAEISGSPAAGFQVGAPQINPAQAEISGPAAAVDRVASVVAPVNVDGLRSTLDQNVSLLAIDTNGTQVPGVTVDPGAVSVTLPVQQLGGYRDLVVKPDLIGAVKTGFRLTGLTVTPSVVTLYSDNADVVSNLPGYVMTQPLDINGAQEDITRSLSLVLPAGVQVVGDPQILVQVSISAIEDSITLTRPVRLQGLAPGLTATASPSAVDVFLSGPVPELRLLLLQPSDIDVYLDLAGKSPGTYKIQPTVRIINVKLNLVTTSPEQIEVAIQAAAAP